MRILIRAPFLAMAKRNSFGSRHIRLADEKPNATTLVNSSDALWPGMMYHYTAPVSGADICTTNIYTSVALNVADVLQFNLSGKIHHWP